MAFEEGRRLPYDVSVVAAVVVLIGVTVLLMQDGSVDLLNAIGLR
jgi:hypothetical protein